MRRRRLRASAANDIQLCTYSADRPSSLLASQPWLSSLQSALSAYSPLYQHTAELQLTASRLYSPASPGSVLYSPLNPQTAKLLYNLIYIFSSYHTVRYVSIQLSKSWLPNRSVRLSGKSTLSAHSWSSLSSLSLSDSVLGSPLYTS